MTIARAIVLVAALIAVGPANSPIVSAAPADQLVFNYHLQHPGGDSGPGDPNAVFCLDGTYHLHYILRHPWNGKTSFSFVHVTSPDMVHWTWRPTTLQPSFTGHGMFSGTGFLAPDGRPAVIYHGQDSGQNWIAVARDKDLAGWEKPHPFSPVDAAGLPVKVHQWDPDCFRIGDTFYAVSGGTDVPLFKSRDLKTWTRVGPFISQQGFKDILGVEDISCPNFFPIGSKWMLLCISHQLGCRYFLGSWDAQREQFIPEKHGRMNWRRHGVPWNQMWTGSDVFAPESVLTPDGRRVMWAWLGGLHPSLSGKTIQSLPRELSLPDDEILRIKPLRELENLREDHERMAAVDVPESPEVWTGRTVTKRLLTLPGKSVEMNIRVPRDAALKRRWGLTLFADGEGGGLPLAFRPENGTIELGDTTAPFSVADLPDAEDVELRIFVDECLVEVFVNERQALVAAWFAKNGQDGVDVWSLGKSFPIGPVDIWKLRPANLGFLAARESGNWQPQTTDAAGPGNAREDQPGQQP